MKKKTLEDISKQINPLDKRLQHLLRPAEVKMINKLVPLVPPWLETYHLTLMKIPLAVAIVLVGFWGQENKAWLWGQSLIIIAHYLSDALDGEVGRRRETGLVRWGFYADHFLDFIFIQSLVLSYLLAFPENRLEIFLAGGFLEAIFIHEALSGILTGRFNVNGYGGLGGIEGFLVLILFNSWVAWKKLATTGGFFWGLLAAFSLTVAFQFLKKSRQFWQQDMEEKAKNQPEKKERIGEKRATEDQTKEHFSSF